MQGQRIYCTSDDGDYFVDPAMTQVVDFRDLPNGSYWKIWGEWFAKLPNGLHCALRGHQVTEHDDGTITVAPSILTTYDGADGRVSWHGYLERGVWREC